ncbi:MAG: hypothetical protein AAF824_12755 [Bacteroidota bacterium]
MRYAILALVIILDIFLLFWTSNRLGRLARKKGQKVGLWVTYGFIGYVLGALAVVFLATVVMGIMNIGLIWAWPVSLLGGFVAYLYLRSSLKRKPDAFS